MRGFDFLIFCFGKKRGVNFCFTLEIVRSDFFSCLVSKKRKKGGATTFLEVKYYVHGVMVIGESFS